MIIANWRRFASPWLSITSHSTSALGIIAKYGSDIYLHSLQSEWLSFPLHLPRHEPEFCPQLWLGKKNGQRHGLWILAIRCWLPAPWWVGQVLWQHVQQALYCTGHMHLKQIICITVAWIKTELEISLSLFRLFQGMRDGEGVLKRRDPWNEVEMKTSCHSGDCVLIR